MLCEDKLKLHVKALIMFSRLPFAFKTKANHINNDNTHKEWMKWKRFT